MNQNIRKIYFYWNYNSKLYFSTKTLSLLQWPLLRTELKQFFQNQVTVTSSIDYSIPYELETYEWPPFCQKETLKDSGLIPASISKYGEYKRFCVSEKKIQNLAFEEPEGHISMYFSARPFNLCFKEKSDLSVVSKVLMHPVKKEIYFIEFSRHIPGKVTTIDIPCSLLGLLACPAYLKGYQVELCLPKIRCQIVGSKFPLPFQIDISKFECKNLYSAIYLSDLQKYLYKDGSVRFDPQYNKELTEVVWAYPPGSLPELKLPNDWVDPNFLNRYGNPINLTYKGYRPKQS